MKELSICLPRTFAIYNLSSFEQRILVLIVPVPGHCLFLHYLAPNAVN